MISNRVTAQHLAEESTQEGLCLDSEPQIVFTAPCDKLEPEVSQYKPEYKESVQKR